MPATLPTHALAMLAAVTALHDAVAEHDGDSALLGSLVTRVRVASDAWGECDPDGDDATPAMLLAATHYVLKLGALKGRLATRIVGELDAADGVPVTAALEYAVPGGWARVDGDHLALLDVASACVDLSGVPIAA